MAKEMLFKGKTLDELKAMGIPEFAKLLPARQRRSLKRGFTPLQKRLIGKIAKYQSGKTKKPVKTHCRDMVILPSMVGLIIHIHKGKTFEPVSIELEMLGHYLGEFVMTRSKVQHSAPGIGATKSSAAASVK
jgi:small subunit ribosomal protein S19